MYGEYFQNIFVKIKLFVSYSVNPNFCPNDITLLGEHFLTERNIHGKGNGYMHLEELSYTYTYAVKDNEFKIDFKENSVRDCTYTFSIKDDTLTIIGREGTVGGTYELHKVQ